MIVLPRVHITGIVFMQKADHHERSCTGLVQNARFQTSSHISEASDPFECNLPMVSANRNETSSSIRFPWIRGSFNRPDLMVFVTITLAIGFYQAFHLHVPKMLHAWPLHKQVRPMLCARSRSSCQRCATGDPSASLLNVNEINALKNCDNS